MSEPAGERTGATAFHADSVGAELPQTMRAARGANTVSATVRRESHPFPLEPFGLDRFESRSREFEFFSVSA